MKTVQKLIDATGAELKVGDRVKNHRNEEVEIVGFSTDRMRASPASTGRVTLRDLKDGWEQEFFPSVIGAKFC